MRLWVALKKAGKIWEKNIYFIFFIWKASFSFSSWVRVTSFLIRLINCQNCLWILAKFFFSFFLLFLLAEIAWITKSFIFLNSDDFSRSDSFINGESKVWRNGHDLRETTFLGAKTVRLKFRKQRPSNVNKDAYIFFLSVLNHGL